MEYHNSFLSIITLFFLKCIAWYLESHEARNRYNEDIVVQLEL